MGPPKEGRPSLKEGTLSWVKLDGRKVVTTFGARSWDINDPELQF